MATFKEYIFIKNRKKDGTYAVTIRVTHNRKSRYLPTNIFVTDSQITRTGRIKDRYIQDIVNKKLKEYRDLSYEISIGTDDLSVDEFLSILKKKTDKIDFFEFAELELEKIKRDKDRKSTYRVYKSAIDSLKKFAGTEQLRFDDMKKGFIQAYYDDLLLKVSDKSANNYIARIKAIYNIAISKLNDEEAGVIVVKYHCFDGLNSKRSEISLSKSFSTIEEMQAIIDCPYQNSKRANFAKDMFILSFLLNGMNMSDISSLRQKDMSGDTIIYYRHKISRRCRDAAKSVIKILPIARAIINKYSGDPDYLIKFRRLENFLSYTNSHIKTIFDAAGINNEAYNSGRKTQSRYTFNTARHTMASFCRNICHVPKDIVDLMLVHVQKEVDVYYQKPYNLMWEANEKLYALFDWSNYEKMLKETTKGS